MVEVKCTWVAVELGNSVAMTHERVQVFPGEVGSARERQTKHGRAGMCGRGGDEAEFV